MEYSLILPFHDRQITRTIMIQQWTEDFSPDLFRQTQQTTLSLPTTCPFRVCLPDESHVERHRLRNVGNGRRVGGGALGRGGLWSHPYTALLGWSMGVWFGMVWNIFADWEFIGCIWIYIYILYYIYYIYIVIYIYIYVITNCWMNICTYWYIYLLCLRMGNTPKWPVQQGNLW